jgi:hypothetical protein
MDEQRKKVDGSATWDGYELDIAVSLSGLECLIAAFDGPEYGSLEFIQSTNDSVGVDSIIVVLGDGYLVLTVSNKVATISGEGRFFLLLAESLRNLATVWREGGRQHIHFDPSSDVLLLSPNSEAFIVGPIG